MTHKITVILARIQKVSAYEAHTCTTDSLVLFDGVQCILLFLPFNDLLCPFWRRFMEALMTSLLFAKEHNRWF